MSAYSISSFLAACAGGPTKVWVSRGAEETAASDFGLITKERVLQFIAANGLEGLRHLRQDPWANNPDKATPIDVDSYCFASGPKQGYLAFFFQPKTGKWIIKSFKLDSASPLSATIGELASFAKTLDPKKGR